MFDAISCIIDCHHYFCDLRQIRGWHLLTFISQDPNPPERGFSSRKGTALSPSSWQWRWSCFLCSTVPGSSSGQSKKTQKHAWLALVSRSNDFYWLLSLSFWAAPLTLPDSWYFFPSPSENISLTQTSLLPSWPSPSPDLDPGPGVRVVLSIFF